MMGFAASLSSEYRIKRAPHVSTGARLIGRSIRPVTE